MLSIIGQHTELNEMCVEIKKKIFVISIWLFTFCSSGTDLSFHSAFIVHNYLGNVDYRKGNDIW